MKLTVKEVLVIVAIVVSMVGSLLYGFLVAGIGKIDNCWDKYSTEQEAIQNCEGEN
jgi:hypothetical protein